MWQGLASYGVRAPAQAALLALTTLLLSLFFPPLAVLSGALVALVWLRHGSKQGALAVVISLAAGTLIAGLSGRPALPAGMMLSFWLPVLLMAFVLRKTVSLNLAILAGAMLALVGVLLTYMLLPDPAEAWSGMVKTVTELVEQRRAEQGLSQTSEADREKMLEVIRGAGSWMTGFSAATQLLFAVASLLLARMWQARMFNPGGLQKEFHELRFGATAGMVGLVLIAAALLLKIELLNNLAIVALVLFALQGLAVMHCLVKQKEVHVAFLVLVYVMVLFLAPHSIQLLGLLGLLDTWVDFRSRLQGQSN